MYDSGTSCASLIESIKSETDISIDIPTEAWKRWINETEQLAYTEIIRLPKKAIIEDPVTPAEMTSIIPANGEKQPIFEDIIKFFAGKHELIKISLTGAEIYKRNSYWNDGGRIGFNLIGDTPSDVLKVIYCVRPELKTISSDTVSGNIMLPPEFIEMVAARLRGEAYKLANEDTLSAKWISDYNSYIENLKVWVTAHGAEYGE